MDQLKQVMAQVAKHQFWIISGLSVILGIVGFFMTSSTLSKLYSDQASALDKLYGDLNTVKSEMPKHPNDKSKAKMEGIIAEVRNDVEAAWNLQYERQTKLLVWPETALGNKKLVEKLKKYSPIETTLTYPDEPAPLAGGLNTSEKDQYAKYFGDQMPEIVKIIGCEWVGKASEASTAGGPGGMGMGGGAGMMSGGGMGDGGMAGMEGGMGGGMAGMMGGGGSGAMGAGMQGMTSSNDLVIWRKPSQDELINSIRLWRGSTPTLYEILYTQENMWILEGIMRIIAKTNEGAKANFQTTIKEIEFIRIGKPAVGRAGMVDTPMSASSGGMGMGGMGGMGEGSMGGMEGMMAGMGSMGGMGGEAGEASASMGGEGGEGAAVVPTSDPAAGRYVDSTYAPITGDDLRSKMQSENPEDAYFAVAKRVPVRLRFKMDQRKVPQFLTDCGNADLMLEIRQIRVGNTTPAASGASGMGGMGGMMAGMGGGMDMGGGGRGGMMGGMGAGMDGAGGDGYGSGMEGGMGGMAGMMGGGMGGMMGMGSGGTVSAKPSWEMPIEVYGVIYLYNPVSIKRLGLDKVTEDTELADKVETPAATEPAPAQAEGTQAPANPNVDPNAPAAGAGAPAGAPAAGTPGVPAPGTPAPGTPAPGTPAPGTPAAGVPAPGTPAPGTPAPGTPAPGTPAPGTPAPGTPAPGTPAPGTPAAGAPGTPAPGTQPANPQ